MMRQRLNTNTAGGSPFRNSLDLPEGCPEIPDEVPLEDLVAIVTVHHQEAYTANRNDNYRKLRVSKTNHATNRQEAVGCHIFLHRIPGQPTYSFGRPTPKDDLAKSTQIGTPSAPELDVFLPSTSIAKKQFMLIPDHASGCWRLDASSETITTVNRVPLQKFTTRTKKNKTNLPQTLYLDQSCVNHVQVPGMEIAISLLMTVAKALEQEPSYEPPPLSDPLQDVAGRAEEWAQSPFTLSKRAEQVSGKSYRALQRFTGETKTVKMYSGVQGTRERDSELLMFCKEQVHDSIVRYQASTQFDGIPAVITDTHYGMAPYGAIHHQIKDQHPGYRFRIASGLLRPLFSALEYLHFHSIIHGAVTWDSVLLRLRNGQLDRVLLVDYSSAHNVSYEEGTRRIAMLQDAQQTMEIIEDCCNLWALRKAPSPNAKDEAHMRALTEQAEQDYLRAQRVCADLFDNKGRDRHSAEGRKMRKVLANKEMEWSRAKTDQLHNAGQVQVGLLTYNKVDEIVKKWRISNVGSASAPDHPMILTLGHKFLDDLANSLFRTPWEITPQEVCGKLRTLEGEVKNPWRKLPITLTFNFDIGSYQETVQGPLQVEIDSQSLIQYLAVCTDVFQDWRDAINTEYERVIAPTTSLILQGTVGALRKALGSHGHLPSSMTRTLRHLETLMPTDFSLPLQVTEVHDIWYHVPSSMFNVTQLHRLATLPQLKKLLGNESIRCDNFVEVRGESNIQGCYVPLSLLSTFASAMGVAAQESLVREPQSPVQDPANFSQVSQGRIVLAHRGLVAFATALRTGNQFSHLPKDPTDIETAGLFLPTYFGNMKVFPTVPNDAFNFPRPTHWAKFKTTEAIEQAAHVNKRKTLKPTGSSKQRGLTLPSRSQDQSLSLSSSATSNNGHFSRLQSLIKERTSTVANTHTVMKRAAMELEEMDAMNLRATRMRSVHGLVERTNPGLTHSFLARNPNITRSPPRLGIEPYQPFGHVEPSKSLAHERKIMKVWMAEMTSSSDEEEEYRTRVRRPISRLPRIGESSALVADDEIARAVRNASPTEKESTIADAAYQQSLDPNLLLGLNIGPEKRTSTRRRALPTIQEGPEEQAPLGNQSRRDPRERKLGISAEVKHRHGQTAPLKKRLQDRKK